MDELATALHPTFARGRDCNVENMQLASTGTMLWALRKGTRQLTATLVGGDGPCEVRFHAEGALVTWRSYATREAALRDAQQIRAACLGDLWILDGPVMPRRTNRGPKGGES